MNQVSNTLIHGLGYIYRYDNRNNLVEKKIPGKGWEYIVYDKLDRPVLTQDAKLRQDGQWLFTKYDAFGRVAYTGIYSIQGNAAKMNRSMLQNTVYNQSHVYESREPRQKYIADGALEVDYTNQVYPTFGLKIHTVNYYDDYNFDLRGIQADGTSIYPSNPSLNNGNFTTITKTLATGGHVRVLETDQWITSLTKYDEKARPVYSHSKNEYLSSETKTHTKLNFIGEVLATKTTHHKDGDSTPLVIADKFTYDHAGRLLKQTQTINDQSEELIVFNKYDELGQLIEKKVGGQDSSNTNYQNTNGLQEIDYSYNIRGWLKSINDVDSPNPDQLFAFKLNYNNPEDNGTTALYNGNISETHWRSQNIDTQKRSYAYHYDALNRIKAADYLTPHAMTGLFKGDENYSLSNIEYDYNGNIKTLHRYGATVSNDIDYIDKLVYDYKPFSNQLNKVDDTAGENGFKDGDHQKDYDYKYDINGNMIQDLNKDIATIEYNHLNLPIKVIFNTSGYQNREISYLYDATGVKLEKIVNTGTFLDGSSAGLEMITHTQYDGGFIYKYTGTSTPELTFFSHPEGYIEPDNQGGFDYVFQFKDHLGNIRLSYKNVGTPTNPVLDIIEEKNYYPFGLEHKGYNNVVNGVENNYQTFQGQEKEEELGKSTYAYQWRDYDPAIARFNKIDRFAEKYVDVSPYHFSKNNPIYFREVKGDSINVSNLMFKNGKLNAEGLHVLFNVLSDLQDITGTSISINANGNLVSKDGKKDANGNLSGSAKARTYLNSIISSTKTINITNDNSKSTQGGGIGSVNINSNQIDGNIQAAKNGGVEELSFGYGMSFLHESLHTATGTLAVNANATQAIGDPPKTTPNATGPTVDMVNGFRSELGLSTRSNYYWQQSSTTSPATMEWNVGGTSVKITKTTMPATDQANRRKPVNDFINFINNFQF